VHPALYDAEQGVGVAFVAAPGALCPAQRQAHRLAGFALGARIRAMHSSNTMTTSASSTRWMRIDSSA